MEKNTISMTESQEIEKIGYKQELRRTLKFRDLVIFGLLTVLPIAPVQVYGAVSQQTMGLATLVYVVGMVAMLFTALSYSTLSGEFPLTGSAYMFVRRAINPHVGFVSGWIILIDYIIVPSLLVSFGALWASNLIPSIPAYVWVIIFIAICTFINGRGINVAAKANIIMLILELICIVFFVTMAIKFIFIDGRGVGGFSIDPFYIPGQVNLGFIASATTIAIFGYLGFDGITALAEEVENPRKTIGKSIITTLLLIGALFIGQSYLATLAHPDYSDLNPDMAFFDIAREVGGASLYYFFVIVAIVAVGIANALVVQTSTARVIFSMGRDNTLPMSKFFAKVHPKFQTPLNATITVGVLTLFIALAPPTILLQLVSFGALTSFMLINVSVFVYFYVRKKERGPKSIFKYVLLPLIGLIIILYVWSGLGKATFILGISWSVIGIILGFVKSKGYKIIPSGFEEN
ncbi:MAG: APC family permease [Eubacteriales bacterium]|nr:APC family permease [Eubacteriales bacterium]